MCLAGISYSFALCDFTRFYFIVIYVLLSNPIVYTAVEVVDAGL